MDFEQYWRHSQIHTKRVAQSQASRRHARSSSVVTQSSSKVDYRLFMASAIFYMTSSHAYYLCVIEESLAGPSFWATYSSQGKATVKPIALFVIVLSSFIAELANEQIKK